MICVSFFIFFWFLHPYRVGFDVCSWPSGPVFFPSETEQKRNLTSKTQKATTGTKAVPVSLLFLCGCKYNFESYTGSLWIFLRLGVYGAHFCVLVRLPTSCRQDGNPFIALSFFLLFLLPSFSLGFPTLFKCSRAQQCARLVSQSSPVLSSSSTFCRLVRHHRNKKQ